MIGRVQIRTRLSFRCGPLEPLMHGSVLERTMGLHDTDSVGASLPPLVPLSTELGSIVVGSPPREGGGGDAFTLSSSTTTPVVRAPRLFGMCIPITGL